MTHDLDAIVERLMALLGPSHPHDEGRECGTCAAYNLLAATPLRVDPMTPTDPLEAARVAFDDDHEHESWFDEEGVDACKTCGIGWPCAAVEYVNLLLATPRPAGDLPLRRWTAGKWTEDHDR